jgi:U5 small nuclear ribonucleoprotein component
MAHSLEGFEDVEIVVERHLGDVTAPLWEAPEQAAPGSHRVLSAASAPLMIGMASGVHEGASWGSTTAPSSQSFLDLLIATKGRKRIVTLIGAPQHGKTSVLRLMGFTVSHDCPRRRMTTVCSVTGAVMEGSSQRTSVLLSVVDTPGSVALQAEARSGVRLGDCALLCVDSVEGLLPHTETLLRYAALETRRVLLVITKIDRLVAELRLPPATAYEKLKQIVNSVNIVLASCNAPTLGIGQLVFASSKYEFAFTLSSVARMYAERFEGVSPRALANKLWGDVTFDTASRRFVPSVVSSKASFVTFVLEPLYKRFVRSIIEPGEHHNTLVDAAKEGLKDLFGAASASLVDAVCETAPSADDELTTVRNQERRNHLVVTTTPSGGDASTSSAVLAEVVFVTVVDEASYAAVRVYRGQLRRGQTVKASWRNDVADTCVIEDMFLMINHALVPRDVVGVGLIALIRSPALVGKFDKVLVLVDETSEVPDFHPPTSATSFARVAIEPQQPQDLAKLKAALREVSARYCGTQLIVEETGECVIEASTEAALDIALYDVRRTVLKGKVPVSVSDPFVAFRETVSTAQGVLRAALDNDVRLEMTAGTLSRATAKDLDSGHYFTSGLDRAIVERSLRERGGWDILDARRWLAFGPDPVYGPCALVNDTLDGAIFPRDASDAVVRGFRLSSYRGPLCSEPMREVKFSVIDCRIPNVVSDSSRTPISALNTCSNLSRALVKTAFLSAAPRLMEPVAAVDIILPVVRIRDIQPVIQRRRGVIHHEAKIAATPLTVLRVLVPLIDSYGMETEVRMVTSGDAHLSTAFDHWAVVPGDPFDEGVQLRPLQAAHGYQLARDFVLKTRRRKGLPAVPEMS